MFKFSYIFELKFNLKHNNTLLMKPINNQNFTFLIKTLKLIYGQKNIKLYQKYKKSNFIMLIKSPHLYKYSKHILSSNKINYKLDIIFEKNNTEVNFFKSINNYLNYNNKILFSLPQIIVKKQYVTYITTHKSFMCI